MGYQKAYGNGLSVVKTNKKEFENSSHKVIFYNTKRNPQSQPDKDTEIVVIQFNTIEERNNYIEAKYNNINQNKDHKSFENHVLSCIGEMHFRKTSFKRVSGRGGFEDHKSFASSEGDREYVRKHSRHHAIGLGHQKWKVQLYNPPPEVRTGISMPSVLAHSTGHSVSFLYTSKLVVDDNLIKHMNLEQLRSIYNDIALKYPDSSFNESTLKDKINSYAKDSEKVTHAIVKNLPIKSDFDLPGHMIQYDPLMIVKPKGMSSTLRNKLPIFECDIKNKKSALGLSSHNGNDSFPLIGAIEYRPYWLRSAFNSNDYWSCRLDGHLGNSSMILKQEQIAESGEFSFEIYLGYRRDASDKSNISISASGYNEAANEIKAAIAAAQELKQLYEQYRQDFESKFKDVMKQDRYKHLMLHEELLTIRDFGPEVATLNEQLYFLHYSTSTNSHTYTTETYDAVIKFKNYMKKLDIDLYDVLEIYKPCGDSSIDSRCNSNSSSPCGCWTYSCYLFKEITFLDDPQKAQIKWSDNSDLYSPFQKITPSGGAVVNNNSSSVMVDNVNGNGGQKILAQVNEGYELKIRITAYGQSPISGNQPIQELDQNLIYQQGNSLATPFVSPFGDCYTLDMTLRGNDTIAVEGVSNPNEPFLIDVKRFTQNGKMKSMNVGNVQLFTSNEFNIKKLNIEILDVRAPWSDWKLHGHGSPPGWNRVNGVAGLTLVAQDFTDAISENASGANIFFQVDIFIGVELFYVVSVEIGGFIGLKFDLQGNHIFKSGSYLQAQVDIGVAKASGRIEGTKEWGWTNSKELTYAMRDWMNQFVPASYEMPLPKGFKAPVTKTYRKSHLDLGGKLSTEQELSENAFKYEFETDHSVLNFASLSSNQSKNETTIAFGKKWSKSEESEPSPSIPSSTSSILSHGNMWTANILNMLSEYIAAKYSNGDNGNQGASDSFIDTLIFAFKSFSNFYPLWRNYSKSFSFGKFAELKKSTTGTFEAELFFGAKLFFNNWLNLQTYDYSTSSKRQLMDNVTGAAKEWNAGIGVDFNGKVAAGFKVYTYPWPMCSVYFGAKFTFGFEGAANMNLFGGSKPLKDIELQDIIGTTGD